MTKKVITVKLDTPLIEAVNILLKNGFNGLPVVEDGILVGIVTEYDMIIKGSSIHLPTFLRLFEGLEIYKKDPLIKDELKKVFNTKVRDVINNDPLTLFEFSSVFEVVDTFTKHHKVNPIPIVDQNKKLLGIISRSDMLRFLGDASLNFRESLNQEEVDKNIDKFLSNFDKKFVLVSKFRTHFWFIASILFAILGFVIAFAIILRINF